MNLRPFGPEPNALPNCATPRSGADEGTRTLDLLITNRLLYQLSHIGIEQLTAADIYELYHRCGKKSSLNDSNGKI